MGRIENPEVKEYLVDYVADYLEQSSLFTKVFGKKFARKKLATNVVKVFTNEVNNVSGYYCFNDNTITLCTKDEEPKKLEPIDIENNIELQGTILHEGVHAVLKKSILECMHYDITAGSGVLEQYSNNTELGRGLNEGLTNWIVERNGMKLNSYKTLTNYIYMLELGIGEERVMRLAKGNMKNVARNLKLPLKKCKAFLANADEIYFIKSRINDIADIIRVLRNYEKLNELPEEEREKVKKQYEALSKNQIYNDVLKENMNCMHIEDEIILFENELHNEKDKFKQSKNEFDNILYKTYFQKEFFEVSKMENIPAEKLIKFDELSEIISEEKLDETSRLGVFNKLYEQLIKEYEEKIYRDAEIAFNEGTLSGKKLYEFERLLIRQVKLVDEKFLKRMAELLCPTQVYETSNLLYQLEMNGQLGEAKQYSIDKIKLEDYEISVCSKNGKVISLLNRNGTLDSENNKVIGDNIEFSFTLDLEEENGYQDIINQFLALKSSIEKQKPNATIKILDRLILIEDEGEQSFYIIHNGTISPATIDKSKQINLKLAPNEPTYPTIHKENLLSKLFRNFKKKELKNVESAVCYNTDGQEEFRNKISDMNKFNKDIYIDYHNYKTEEKESDREI